MTPREREAPPVASTVVVDSRWYADMLGSPALALQDVVRRRCPGDITAPLMRFGVLRGLALGALSYRAAAVGVIKNTRGALVALAVAAVRPGRSRLVLLEFIRRPLPRRGWKRVGYLARFRLIERPLVRRGMTAGQVLTGMERERYRDLYGVPAKRLPLIRWAYSAEGREADLSRPGAGGGVLASGRTSCDWETLFAAAAGRSWPLTVVCSPHDLSRVRALNRGGRARVLCEISGAEHGSLPARQRRLRARVE